MAITRLNFNTLADGGDDATGAFQKLDANDFDLDTRLASAIAGLGNASGKNVGTAVGTVAAGDDIRFFQSGRRNLLINGNLRTNQRVFAGGAMTANSYGYDRWRTFGAASSFSLSSDLTTITLNGTVGQVIEAPAAGGATVTISIANPSGPVTANIRPDATTAGVSGVIQAGAGVQSVTLVVPSSITGNVYLQLTTAAAVTFDGPAKRSGIQMELGSFAGSFDVLPLGQQLMLCQRYYEKTFNVDVAPANQTTAGVIISSAAFATSAVRAYAAFKVPKRGTSAITFYHATENTTPAPGMHTIFQAGTWTNATATNATAISNAGFNIDCNSTGLTQYFCYLLTGHWAADADL